MKSILLYICLFILIILNTSSAQIFSDEPVIRVRIIYTLDSLNIIFNDEWTLTQDKSQEEIKIHKED
ncbi:MAG: hypothetical protein KBF59_02090, partial [Ignavibacterium sp.]|nr:hypothetical protein [Ignavibacterium sp.]